MEYELAGQLSALIKKFPRVQVRINNIQSSEGPKWWVQIRHSTHLQGPSGHYYVEYSDVNPSLVYLANSVKEIRELLEAEKDLV